MLKSIIDSTLEWEWKTRIYISSILVLISTLILLFFERLWIWGYAGAAFLIFTALLFKEKHVEYDEEKAEELILSKFSVNSEKLKGLLNFLLTISVKGFDQTKIELIIKQAESLAFGEQRMFNYYIITEETKTSVSIQILKQETDVTLSFTSNQSLNQALKNFMERN